MVNHWSIKDTRYNVKFDFYVCRLFVYLKYEEFLKAIVGHWLIINKRYNVIFDFINNIIFVIIKSDL